MSLPPLICAPLSGAKLIPLPLRPLSSAKCRLRPAGLGMSAYRDTGQPPNDLLPIPKAHVDAVHSPVIRNLLGISLRHEHSKLWLGSRPDLRLHLGSRRHPTLPR